MFCFTKLLYIILPFDSIPCSVLRSSFISSCHLILFHDPVFPFFLSQKTSGTTLSESSLVKHASIFIKHSLSYILPFEAHTGKYKNGQPVLQSLFASVQEFSTIAPTASQSIKFIFTS